MVNTKTGSTSLLAVCGALTALVKENGDMRREVKRLRHHVSKLAKKLHGKSVELGKTRIELDERTRELTNERMGWKERGEKEEVAVEADEMEEEEAAEVAPVSVAEVPEPVVAEPLVAGGEWKVGVAEVEPVRVGEVHGPRLPEPPRAVSVEDVEEEVEVFGRAVVRLPDGGEAAVRDTQSSAALLRMAREEEERKRSEWKMVESGQKKRKVEVITAPVGPRLWNGQGRVAVVGDMLDVVPVGPRAARNYVRAQGEGQFLRGQGRGSIARPLPRVRSDFGQMVPWRDRLRRR